MNKYKDNRNLAIMMIWYERFLECSRTQGTSEFPKSVWRFYHSLLNINNDDLAIKSKVISYVDNEWKPEIKKRVRKTMIQYTGAQNDSSISDMEYGFKEAQYIYLVFDFIIQVIQDSGLGWPTKDDIQNFQITQE